MHERSYQHLQYPVVIGQLESNRVGTVEWFSLHSACSKYVIELIDQFNKLIMIHSNSFKRTYSCFERVTQFNCFTVNSFPYVLQRIGAKLVHANTNLTLSIIKSMPAYQRRKTRYSSMTSQFAPYWKMSTAFF